MGKAYCRTGQIEKGAALFRKLLVVRRKQIKDDGQFALLLSQFATILLEAKAYPAAEPMLRECLRLRERANPNDWTTFSAQSQFGAALLGQQQYAEAEPLLLQGYEGMKACEESLPQVPQPATHIRDALDRLIELYTAMGKRDEARKWQIERDKYPSILPSPEKH